MTKVDLKGKLIVFEGLDFTGKSTQVKLLADWLGEKDVTVTATREPGGTRMGERLRDLVLSRKNTEIVPLSELLLIVACRAQLYREVIKPSLDRGDTVLSSRYRLSSLAYQGYGRGIDLDLIRRLNDAATKGQRADITLLIDLPEDVALARKRGHGDRIEGEDLAFYRRVRRGYIELARGDESIHTIEGTGSITQIAESVRDYLDTHVLS